MRHASPQSEAQQIDWAYEASQPWKTLLRLINKGPGYYLLCVLLYTIKNCPLWMVAILPAAIIDNFAHPETANYTYLIGLAIATVVLLLCNIPTHVMFVRLFSDATRAMEQQLRLAVARRLQQVSLSHHGGFESGRMQSKMLRDVEQVQLTTMEVGMNGIGAVVQLCISVGYTALHQPRMLLFFLIIAPAAIGVSRTFQSAIRGRNQRYRQDLESMNTRVVDMVGMLPLARAHGVEETAISDVSQRVIQVNENGRRLDRINAVFASSTWVTFQIFGLCILAMSAWLVYRGAMQLGGLVIYTTFFTQLVFAINQLLNLYPQFNRGLESVRSLREVLSSPDIEHNEGKQVVESVQGNITFESVSFTYPGSAAPALHDVNLHIPAGKTVAIVGASGGGKSTLINLAIGFNRPSSGRILLDGADMEQLDMRTWRRKLSLVPQQIALFNGTIRENILFGLPAIGDEFFDRVLRLTHVNEFVAQLPLGVDTAIGEGGARLSGGQKQRIAIARALMRDPRVIVLDEPTSALDLRSEQLVQKALDELTRDRTTIIVAHRLSTIRNAHLVCVLAEGRIAECGTHDELLAKGGLFTKLHAAASSGHIVPA